MTRIEKATIEGATIKSSTVEVSGTQIDLSKMENKDNKVSTMPDSPTTEQYPTAGAVKTYVDGKVIGLYKFKGTFANQTEFDAFLNDTTKTAEVGDVYDTLDGIIYDGKGYPAGTNFAVKRAEVPRVMDALGGMKINDTTKVPIEVIGTNGKARIFNEADGGGAKFEFSDGMESFVGVNNEEMALQLYVDRPNGSGGWEGATIKGYNDKFYYQNSVNRTSGSKPEDKFEIATVGLVKGSQTRVGGVEELKSININGEDWNIPEAGVASVEWGGITGTLANQTDLQEQLDSKATITALNEGLALKQNVASLESDVSTLGFTKNAGTLTGVNMNGSAVSIVGSVADLGTVITAHQDISGKQDSLNAGQMSACNSGITVDKVEAYDGYATSKVNVSDIIDNLTSAIATQPLSANQGVTLKGMITNISTIGRFLSTWDCTTGKPDTNPPGGTPYTYKSGDYYIVSSVGITNYRPNGSQYDGTPSTTTESETVSPNDIYKYDGTTWVHLSTDVPTTSFSTLAGNATDNTSLSMELGKKIDKLESPTTAGTKCKITFDANGLVTAGEDINASDVKLMTGYVAPTTASTTEIASTDTLNGAMAKLQAQIKYLMNNYITGDKS